MSGNCIHLPSIEVHSLSFMYGMKSIKISDFIQHLGEFRCMEWILFITVKLIGGNSIGFNSG